MNLCCLQWWCNISIFISASGPVLPSWDRSLLSPRTLKGNGLQICKVQQWLFLAYWKVFGGRQLSICQTSGLKTAQVLQGLLWQPLLLESCTWWQEYSIEAVGCRTEQAIDEETWGKWKAQECPKEDPWIKKGWTQQEIDDWHAKKRERNKEKKKGPRRGRLKRWSAAKWP